jgi:hypothetical protein
VDRLLPTPENAQKIGIVAIATADPNATLNLHARDIYFGSAQYGCRLTSTADVTNFDSSPDLIAFVRTSETGHTQLWLLHQDTLKIELAVNGREPEKFAGPSTEGQNSLTFSRDGRYLYFTADACATSSAIMELDINTKKTRFVASAGEQNENAPTPRRTALPAGGSASKVSARDYRRRELCLSIGARTF